MLGRRIAAHFTACGNEADATRCEEGGLSGWTAAHFSSDEALVFIGSAGLAVRAIAPHIKSKITDPAVIVVDERGSYSIALLSGHLGGANALSREIARLINATPVITTATDIHGVFAVDTWAKAQGLIIATPARIKYISSRLLAGQTVRLHSDFPIEGALPSGIELSCEPCDILISCRPQGGAEALHLVPPIVTLGIGCKRGTEAEAIEQAFSSMLAQADCHSAAIQRVCSIDLKADEPGLLEFCRRRALPFATFPAAALASMPGEFTGSAFVKSVTGVDNVCERSALLGSGEGGALLTQKFTAQGVAMALAIAPYVLRFDKEN